MRRTTLAEYIERGGSIPQRVPASYASLRGAPLADGDAFEALARMPGPGALWRLLAEDAPFSLHADGFDAAFVGELDEIWSWPGAREFGVVVLLDPLALGPVRALEFDGYIVDATVAIPRDGTVFAPDPETAQAVAPASDWPEARTLLPHDYKQRITESLRRIERYMDDASSVASLLEASQPDALAGWDLDGFEPGLPLFRQPDDVRSRLTERARTQTGGNE